MTIVFNIFLLIYLKIHVFISVYSYQLKLIKMRAELANLNHYAAPFLSRADANLRWYYYINANRPLHSFVKSTKVQKSIQFLNSDWFFSHSTPYWKYYFRSAMRNFNRVGAATNFVQFC